VAQLSQRFADRPIAVAIEQTRGALVFLLSKYEQLHIFPVPPAMTANLRKAFYSSGTKNDPSDADLLLDLVERHRGTTPTTLSRHPNYPSEVRACCG